VRPGPEGPCNTVVGASSRRTSWDGTSGLSWTNTASSIVRSLELPVDPVHRAGLVFKVRHPVSLSLRRGTRFVVHAFQQRVVGLSRGPSDLSPSCCQGGWIFTDRAGRRGWSSHSNGGEPS
jgi:hypothetical protein